MSDPTTHIYRPRGAMAKALLKAMGLEGHRVTRIEITFDVTMAATVKVYEFAVAERHAALVRFLSGYEWHEKPAEPVASDGKPGEVRDVTALGDEIAQHDRCA